MSSAAKANRNQDSEEMEGKESEQKPEAAKPLDFSDFADATEMSPVMQRIYEKMGNAENMSEKRMYERFSDLVAMEIAQTEGEEKKELLGYQKKVEKLLNEMEEGEYTYVGANRIFENAVINAVNDGLPEENRITSSDGDVNLKWSEEEGKGGHFALVQRLEKKPYTDKDEPGEMVLEGIDEKTGKEIWTRKLSGQVKPREDMNKFYYLQTEQVKEVFDNLEPTVQKTIIDGLKEQIKENKRYADSLKDEAAKKEEDSAREKLIKNLKALE